MPIFEGVALRASAPISENFLRLPTNENGPKLPSGRQSLVDRFKLKSLADFVRNNRPSRTGRVI